MSDLPQTKTYFIQAETGLIKIGKSTEPEKRFASLQTSSPVPLELLGIIDEDVEKYLHHKFSDLRQHGEWFRPVKRLQNYIRNRCGKAIEISKEIPQRKSPGRKDYGLHMGNEFDGDFFPWSAAGDGGFGSSAYTRVECWINNNVIGSRNWGSHFDDNENCDCDQCNLEHFMTWLVECKPNAVVLPKSHCDWVGIVYYPFSVPHEAKLLEPSMEQAFEALDALGPTLNAICLNEDGSWRCRISNGNHWDETENVEPINLDKLLASGFKEEMTHE